MDRKALTPGALYMLLNNELRAKRSFACNCRMPLPFLVERPDEVSANWRIGTPVPCVKGCDAIIAEIAARLWPQFDLHDPTAVPAKVQPTSSGTPSKTE